MEESEFKRYVTRKIKNIILNRVSGSSRITRAQLRYHRTCQRSIIEIKSSYRLAIQRQHQRHPTLKPPNIQPPQPANPATPASKHASPPASQRVHCVLTHGKKKCVLRPTAMRNGPRFFDGASKTCFLQQVSRNNNMFLSSGLSRGQTVMARLTSRPFPGPLRVLLYVSDICTHAPLWSSPASSQNQWTLWTSIEKQKELWKSMKTGQNRWKSTNITQGAQV